MELLLKMKASLESNVNLWLALWILIIINVLTFISLSKGFSWWLMICFIFIALIGGGILRLLAQVADEEELEVPPQVTANVKETMEEIKPLCEDLFAREINNTVDPALDEMNQDFLKGLTWLWENGEEFINSVENTFEDTETISRLFDKLNEGKYSIIQDLHKSIDAVDAAILELKSSKQEDFILLADHINAQRNNLLVSMDKEKEIFYDYLYKLLIEQSQIVEDFDPVKHLDIYKLGEQFTGIIEKSLQNRIISFREKIVEHLEEFSSDVVGRMQKNITRLLNAFRDNQAVLERFNYECRAENHLLLRRIDELIGKNLNAQEQANDILLSLAWQEILVEKRWQEVKNKLHIIKELVSHNLEGDTLNYIKEMVEHEIPGLSYMVKQANGALFYKQLLDAELVYQVYAGKKLNSIINEGAQVLLQYIRPLELLVNHNIRLNEAGLKLRKTIQKRARNGEFNSTFDHLKNLVEADNPRLQNYLDNVFPKGFYSFCNSPYVKKKPDNMNTAGWMLFLGLLDQEYKDEILLLSGLLLIAHQLRNKYIHPLKSDLLELHDEADIELIRYLTYRIITLVISNEWKGIASLTYKYK